MPDGYMSVVTLGFGIINAHILHYLEGELNKFRNTDYLKEILQNHKLDIKPPKNTKEFDNTVLIQIINDDMKDIFLEHEKRLKADGYITSENKWINGRGKNQTKTLKDLANLILFLQEKKYLKPKFDRKPLKESDYRKFFEARYGCNLTDQFKKAKNKSNKTKSIETAKITFFYF